MGRASRDKGARGEREVADLFRAHGFDCARVPNSGGLRLKGDLYGSLPVHVEVKRANVWRWDWLRQAADEAGDKVPVLAFRRDGGGWFAAIPLEHLLGLLAEAEQLRHDGKV